MGLTGSSMANLKMSLDKYCNTWLESSESLNIHYEGVPFDDTAVDDWIQPRIIDVTPIYLRQSSSSNYGEDANVLFQINIFAKVGHQTTSDRVTQIRDRVAPYFKIKQDITIYDYINADADLGNIRVRSIMTDEPMPDNILISGIGNRRISVHQHVFAVEMDYCRETAQP